MAKKKQKSLLTPLPERRGRKPAVSPAEVVEHADYVLNIVASLRDRIAWDKLEAARTEPEAESAITGVPPFYREILKNRLAAILVWVREAKFPKKNLERKMRHLADSVGADVLLSPRRSRDVCYEYRKRLAHEKVGRILRREFYIECTCGSGKKRAKVRRHVPFIIFLSTSNTLPKRWAPGHEPQICPVDRRRLS
jgi:hypothetical protein